MIQRTKTDHFNTGGGAEEERSEPVDKVTNRSRMKEANKMKSGAGFNHPPDGLLGALSASASTYQATRKGAYPSDHDRWNHSKSVRPTGAHYTPAGAFGVTKRTGAGSTHQIYGGNRHSAPSANAVPGRENTDRGDNALPGHQNSRRGQNAVGNPPGRHGTNAVGNPPNRFGENALAGSFRPKFSKPHGHRV